ncbi:hypothetical protein P784_1526 [Enterococcus faecalis GAN13]|nr:hypothetical protein P784_1526 [Enterococcus faecalis GAN13]
MSKEIFFGLICSKKHLQELITSHKRFLLSKTTIYISFY